MFTKYFGLLLIATSIFALFYYLIFYFLSYGGIFSLLVALIIIAVIFFTGKYFYRIGGTTRDLEKSKTNILTRVALTLFVVAILMRVLPLVFAHVFYGNCGVVCRAQIDGFNGIIFTATLILPAMSIILLIIHWLKNRSSK